MSTKLLIALAVQRTIYNVLIHRAGVERYSAPLILLMIDSIHLFVSVIMVSLTGWTRAPTNWRAMILPALLALVKNNCLFWGMMYLDPSLHQLVYQINIIFASLITPLRLSNRQRVSLGFLFVGVCIILYNRDDALILPQHHQLAGIFFTIVGAGSAAMSHQAFEDIIKKETGSVWVRQLQLSALGVCGALLSCLQEYEYIVKSDPISSLMMGLVVVKCTGDIIIPFVLKYTSNVVKGFSDTLAVMMSMVLTQVLYHWHPHVNFWVGAVLIFTAAFMFNHEKIPKRAKILTV
mgnify:FL=1|jgi:hypothetical protein